ncbi:MAG: M6 family metalloprotease domain-containing protein [bacterium]
MATRAIRRTLLLGLAVFLGLVVSVSAIPPKPGLFEFDPVTGLSKSTGRSIVLPPRPKWLDRPEPFKAELATATNNILIILIGYPDLVPTETRQSFTDMVNGLWMTGSLNDYFQEVSYGSFGVSGVSVGWYTAANNHTYYANFDGVSGTDDDFGTGGASEYPHNAPRLVEEAVDAAEAAGVNFASFDNNGDGFVDTVFIVHSGKDGADTGNPNYIWSHKGSIYGGGGTPRYYDGVIIDTYTIQPELNSAGDHIEIGVFAHEYGHVLGLPDLYDTDYSSEGIGNYGLMAGGCWGADGASPWSPSHMCAWSKIYLGWITPTVITEDALNQGINQVETNAEVYKLWKDGIPQREYFLVSNRQKVGFDSRLPGDGGLLVWHIDENVINANFSSNMVNSDENHKGVDLEEADGLNDLDYGRNRGDAGDFYPGSTNNNAFNDTSNPNSRSYSGAITKVEVVNIAPSGDPMVANLKVGASIAPDLQQLKIFPNPFRQGVDHNRIIFAALTQQATIRIYTLTGQLVKKQDVSGQYSWDWDGKNMNGEELARGVYIWVVTNPAGEKRTGKIAIIK